MNDEWLAGRLGIAEQRLEPDPDFAERLYGLVVAELGLDTAAVPVRQRARVRPTRRRAWLGLLLVATVGMVAAGAVAVGAGAFIQRAPDDVSAQQAPHVCQLISATEITAIVGAPVTLTDPEVATSTATTSSTSCEYTYLSPAANQTNQVTLSITRYHDATLAQAQIGPGPAVQLSLPGLGDGAVLYLSSTRRDLFVLHGTDVVSVGAPFSNLSILANAIDPAEMEGVARIILGRLGSH
jgi:hypothetical protein